MAHLAPEQGSRTPIWILPWAKIAQYLDTAELIPLYLVHCPFLTSALERTVLPQATFDTPCSGFEYYVYARMTAQKLVLRINDRTEVSLERSIHLASRATISLTLDISTFSLYPGEVATLLESLNRGHRELGNDQSLVSPSGLDFVPQRLQDLTVASYCSSREIFTSMILALPATISRLEIPCVKFESPASYPPNSELTSPFSSYLPGNSQLQYLSTAAPVPGLVEGCSWICDLLAHLPSLNTLRVDLKSAVLAGSSSSNSESSIEAHLDLQNFPSLTSLSLSYNYLSSYPSTTRNHRSEVITILSASLSYLRVSNDRLDSRDRSSMPVLQLHLNTPSLEHLVVRGHANVSETLLGRLSPSLQTLVLETCSLTENHDEDLEEDEIVKVTAAWPSGLKSLTMNSIAAFFDSWWVIPAFDWSTLPPALENLEVTCQSRRECSKALKWEIENDGLFPIPHYPDPSNPRPLIVSTIYTREGPGERPRKVQFGNESEAFFYDFPRLVYDSLDSADSRLMELRATVPGTGAPLKLPTNLKRLVLTDAQNGAGIHREALLSLPSSIEHIDVYIVGEECVTDEDLVKIVSSPVLAYLLGSSPRDTIEDCPYYPHLRYLSLTSDVPTHGLKMQWKHPLSFRPSNETPQPEALETASSGQLVQHALYHDLLFQILSARISSNIRKAFSEYPMASKPRFHLDSAVTLALHRFIDLGSWKVGKWLCIGSNTRSTDPSNSELPRQAPTSLQIISCVSRRYPCDYSTLDFQLDPITLERPSHFKEPPIPLTITLNMLSFFELGSHQQLHHMGLVRLKMEGMSLNPAQMDFWMVGIKHIPSLRQVYLECSSGNYKFFDFMSPQWVELIWIGANIELTPSRPAQRSTNPSTITPSDTPWPVDEQWNAEIAKSTTWALKRLIFTTLSTPDWALARLLKDLPLLEDVQALSYNPTPFLRPPLYLQREELRLTEPYPSFNPSAESVNHRNSSTEAYQANVDPSIGYMSSNGPKGDAHFTTPPVVFTGLLWNYHPKTTMKSTKDGQENLKTHTAIKGLLAVADMKHCLLRVLVGVSFESFGYDFSANVGGWSVPKNITTLSLVSEAYDAGLMAEKFSTNVSAPSSELLLAEPEGPYFFPVNTGRRWVGPLHRGGGPLSIDMKFITPSTLTHLALYSKQTTTTPTFIGELPPTLKVLHLITKGAVHYQVHHPLVLPGNSQAVNIIVDPPTQSKVALANFPILPPKMEDLYAPEVPLINSNGASLSTIPATLTRLVFASSEPTMVVYQGRDGYGQHDGTYKQAVIADIPSTLLCLQVNGRTLGA